MVSNFQKSIKFYNALGFKQEYCRTGFAFLSLEGSQIMIQQANDTWKTAELVKPFGRGINFQMEVRDVKSILQLAKKNNYPVQYDLQENEYEVLGKKLKQKEFLVEDPDGYLLRFFQET